MNAVLQNWTGLRFGPVTRRACDPVPQPVRVDAYLSAVNPESKITVSVTFRHKLVVCDEKDARLWLADVIPDGNSLSTRKLSNLLPAPEALAATARASVRLSTLLTAMSCFYKTDHATKRTYNDDHQRRQS